MLTDPVANLWHHTSAPDGRDEAVDIEGHYDLVVIGAGFTGLSAALHAAQSGASVLVVEAHHIGFGGSGRNVGLVNAGLWLPPADVAKTMGPGPAERLTSTLATGPDLVFELIEKHQISCEALRNGTLHCAHSEAGMRELERRLQQLLATGAPVSLLSPQEARRRVGSDHIHGALFDPRAGTIQPLAYARGLARAARSAGARIVEDCTARAVCFDAEKWRFIAKNQPVTCDALIDATNAYGTRPGRFAPLHFFQMATDPLPEDMLRDILPGGEGCWDTALVMSSFRRDAAGRIIVGAIGSLDHMAAGLHRLWARRKISLLFPQLGDVPLRHGWSGVIANTGDHLPKILRLGPRGYAAFGYSGRGIGTGTLFGRALAQVVTGADETALPIDPIDKYTDRFTALRGAWYEAGALAAHALGSLRPR